MWNADQHTDDDNLRWSWLRAVEWDAYPFFISQPVVPLLLTAVTWWKILVGLFLVQLVWTSFVLTRFVSTRLSDVGPVIVLAKWIICPLVAFYLYKTDQIWLAVVALTWPIAMLLVVKPIAWGVMALVIEPFNIELSQIGVIQRRLMQQLVAGQHSEGQHEKPPKLCFPIGQYSLRDRVDKCGPLVEFSRTEYEAMGRQFRNEKNFNAAPTIFLDRPWMIQIQTVNGEITKIAPHILMANEEDATQIAADALDYCTRQFGSPVRLNTGLFSWKASDGNGILQTNNTSDGWLVSLFLTSSSVRDLEQL